MRVASKQQRGAIAAPLAHGQRTHFAHFPRALVCICVCACVRACDRSVRSTVTQPSQLLPRFPDRVRTRPASQRSKASARPSRAPPSRRTRSSIATGFLDGPGVCSSCHHSTTRSYYCHTTARILRACARACVWRLACVRVVYSVWRPQLPAPHSCAHTAPNVDGLCVCVLTL